LFPLGGDVVRRATTLAEEAGAWRASRSLRTLHGLHLATAAILRCTGIVTADARMKAGAQYLGIPVIAAP
jgi:hypothetical protein